MLKLVTVLEIGVSSEYNKSYCVFDLSWLFAQSDFELSGLNYIKITDELFVTNDNSTSLNEFYRHSR